MFFLPSYDEKPYEGNRPQRSVDSLTDVSGILCSASELENIGTTNKSQEN